MTSDRFRSCGVTCRVVRAETIAQLEDATRIRGEVFARAMKLDRAVLPALREINGYDVLPTTVVFVAYVDDEAVGTLRVTLPNPELARRHRVDIGLPAAIGWDLRDVPAGIRLVELNRIAILPLYRGRAIVGPLYAAAYAAARATGHTHWLGTTLTGTDDEGDAAIVAAIMARLGHWRPAPRLLDRMPASIARPVRRPIFDESQRARAARGDYDGIPLSSALRFHLRTKVEVIGKPLYDETFGEYLVPVVVDLDTLARSEFGQLYCREPG